ncbi:hypothetical protein [Nonomuraea wenchangensis]|uniref:Uncharacterized protein n=1 Tax=Nonomuraea wenchangensis TaxID=568860 RepID=A0A1I0KR23_9ACTN|nr:hypothetical protein [Nonomuraea wenchangensis]SEU27994.1 hypothetical protein SAMN05421811_109113 [Nonomuraea wenchangensis]
MIRRIIRKRRPAPTLAGISLEEELALIRVELMYGLRVNREAYLRRKVDERNEMVSRMRDRDAAEMLADLRGSLERSVRPTVVDLQSRVTTVQSAVQSAVQGGAADAQSRTGVVDLQSRRRGRSMQDPEPA